MKRVVGKSRTRSILLTLGAVFFVIFILLPLSLSLFSTKTGNVALIPIEGIITSNGGSYLGQATISSKTIVGFIQEANDNEHIKVILLELNSPGGTPVGTDEIAAAVQATEKPVVALIREVSASGGYWIASAADHIISNRMSVTGSIGVLSSYLEFSGLMEDYGVGYERLVAGDNKDIGSPFRKLTQKEKATVQKRLDKLHTFFIEEVAKNRNLPEKKVRELANGDVYLGVEALDLGLVDQLGNKDTAKMYISNNYGIKEIKFLEYVQEVSLLEMLTSLSSQFSFSIGQGLGSILFQQNTLMLI
jgi:protease IV